MTQETKPNKQSKKQLKKRLNKQTLFKRSFTLSRASVDDDKRTVEVAFSSEEPYERHFGIEILDHSKDAVDLSRLNNGGAVLVEHDRDDLVGVVESARVDGDRVARAVLRFGNSERASEIFQDVKDGIRTLISVGYRVQKFEVEEIIGSPDNIRVVKWTPTEISFVAIPADPTVGVDRSDEGADEFSYLESTMEDDDIKNKTEGEPRSQPPAPKPADLKAVREKAARDEQERIRAIDKLADEHDLEDLGRQYVDEGRSVADFKSAVLTEIGKRNNDERAKADPEKDESLGLSDKEVEKFSMIRAMRALANPNDRNAQEAAAYEFDVSSSGAKRVGIEARGMFIPADLTNHVQTRTLTAGTATDGAELVATNLLDGSFIDVLRNVLALAGAGAQFLPGLVGNVDIPRKTSGAAGAWIAAEDGDAAVSEPQFDQVQMTPKDVAAYTEVSRRLMMQSTPAIDGLIRQDLIIAAALAIDSAGLNGSGAAGQPTGVANQTGINTNNLTLAAPTWQQALDIVAGQMTDNALTGSLGWMITPALWSLLSATEKATNTAQFLLADMNMAGYGVTVSNQVPTNGHFFGNWNDLLIGQWGGLELNVDPYTHSLKGRTRFVMFQTVDIAVRHGESFNHAVSV